MSDFEKLLLLQMAAGLAFFFLGLMGFVFVFGLLLGGCSASNRIQAEQLATQQHQEELRLRHEARCQEMLIEGDIVSLRGWCSTSSTRIRPSQRQHACDLVQEYETYCTP